MRASNVEYHAPARFDELLECFVRISRLGRTSVDLRVRRCTASPTTSDGDRRPDARARRPGDETAGALCPKPPRAPIRSVRGRRPRRMSTRALAAIDRDPRAGWRRRRRAPLRRRASSSVSRASTGPRSCSWRTARSSVRARAGLRTRAGACGCPSTIRAQRSASSRSTARRIRPFWSVSRRAISGSRPARLGHGRRGLGALEQA